MAYLITHKIIRVKVFFPVVLAIEVRKLPTTLHLCENLHVQLCSDIPCHNCCIGQPVFARWTVSTFQHVSVLQRFCYYSRRLILVEQILW